MGKIDIDKFMLSLFSQHGEMPKVWEKALLDQGLKYESGELVSVVSPEFEVGDVIKSVNGDTTVITEVTNDFYSTDGGIMPVELQDGFEKIGEAAHRITKGRWYICLEDSGTEFTKGTAYYSPEDNYLLGNSGQRFSPGTKYWREWNLQVDAKDGDYLTITTKGSDYVAIFKGIDEYGRLIAYASYSVTYDGVIVHDVAVCEVSGCTIWPAFKVDQDGLNHKMLSEGKTWNSFEKKINPLKITVKKNKSLNEFKRDLYELLAKIQAWPEKNSSYELAMMNIDHLLDLANKTFAEAVTQNTLDKLVSHFKNSPENYNDKRVADIYRAGLTDMLEYLKNGKIE